jgi:hypothetical protein
MAASTFCCSACLLSGNMKDVPEFTIERDEKAGLFVASLDDPAGGGITTQGKDLREFASAIEEAVRCHFAGRTAPREVALHFAYNPVLQLA